MNEGERVNAWIVARLRADSALMALVANRVYVTGLAPQNPEYPLIRYHMQAETDIRVLNQRAMQFKFIYYLGAVVKTPAPANQLTDILDALDTDFNRVVKDTAQAGLYITSERTTLLTPVTETIGNVVNLTKAMLVEIIAETAA